MKKCEKILTKNVKKLDKYVVTQYNEYSRSQFSDNY